MSNIQHTGASLSLTIWSITRGSFPHQKSWSLGLELFATLYIFFLRLLFGRFRNSAYPHHFSIYQAFLSSYGLLNAPLLPLIAVELAIRYTSQALYILCHKGFSACKKQIQNYQHILFKFFMSLLLIPCLIGMVLAKGLQIICNFAINSLQFIYNCAAFCVANLASFALTLAFLLPVIMGCLCLPEDTLENIHYATREDTQEDRVASDRPICNTHIFEVPTFRVWTIAPQPKFLAEDTRPQCSSNLTKLKAIIAPRHY